MKAEETDLLRKYKSYITEQILGNLRKADPLLSFALLREEVCSPVKSRMSFERNEKRSQWAVFRSRDKKATNLN